MSDSDQNFKALATYTSRVNRIKEEVQLYEQLYCNEASCGILNANLAHVFSIIQRSMFISILTQVSAVFDSKGDYRGNKNLSLDYFIDTHRDNVTEDLLTKFQGIKNRYSALQIKLFRHKYIAHHDLMATIGDLRIDHSVKNGDIAELLRDTRSWCIGLARCLYGEIQTTVEVYPDQLSRGNDGFELLRRLESGK